MQVHRVINCSILNLQQMTYMTSGLFAVVVKTYKLKKTSQKFVKYGSPVAIFVIPLKLTTELQITTQTMSNCGPIKDTNFVKVLNNNITTYLCYNLI